MTDRKFYRHRFQIEILSEENLEEGTSLSLLELDQMTENEQVGGPLVIVETEKLNGKEAVEALYKIGSEPGFFRLDDEGDNTEEEDDTEENGSDLGT